MATATSTAAAPMTKEEKKVIFASSLGTVFEWYDFYLYGSLAPIIAKQFFAGLDPQAAFIASLLAFAAGFIVRPFGALVFGRIGDLVGRKYTFLVTIICMGGATFAILNAMQWPVGSGEAKKFLESFYDAAKNGVIDLTPVQLKIADDAIWWGDGVAVRKGDRSFGVSVFWPDKKREERRIFEEALARKIAPRL